MRLTTDGAKPIEVAVFVQPGQSDFSIQLTLGWGRQKVGRYGSFHGFDVHGLRTTKGYHVATGVKLQKLGAGDVDGIKNRYADLSSASGETATIDYGSGERSDVDVFVGTKVRLADLGLEPRPERRRFLPAPTGPQPKGLELWLAVGDTGELATESGRATFRVIGITHRSIRIEGARYTWEEYVLHAPAAGLRWLVVSDGHWNLVETVDPAQVEESERGAKAFGELYKPWSSGRARLEWATGELPWSAAIGDVTATRDYVRAPWILSCESSEAEITWSRGTYLPTDAVARAFAKRLLPKPSGRAPNQPRTPKQR